MGLSEALLSEFDLEMAHTRTLLQRVPQDRMGWRPHPKSWTLGMLATHIAWLPTWIPSTLQGDYKDVAVPETPRDPAATRTALLDLFDRNVMAARKALVNADETLLREPWSLRRQSKTLFVLPRVVVIRTYVLNHIIHHRAQLGVYMRMNEVPLPSIYGPSADEGSME
jgi:uncharacterized damage-inducible protein DinB